jgi:hypothetical protein
MKMKEIDEAIECMQNLITPQGGKQLNKYGWDYERSHKTALCALKTIKWIENHHSDYSHGYVKEIKDKFQEFMKDQKENL